MLKRIKFTTVPVQDQTSALDFYSKKLGLKIFTDQAMGEDRWIELQVSGAETLLVLHNAKSRADDAARATESSSGRPKTLGMSIAWGLAAPSGRC